METKDKKNDPVVDETVNVGNGDIVNDKMIDTGEVEETNEDGSVVDKVVGGAKTVAKVGNDAARGVVKVVSGVTEVTETAGKVVGGTAKVIGNVVGGAAKSAGLFANITSFFVANIQTIMIVAAISAAVGLVGYIAVDMFKKPQIEDTANIVEEVKKISELTTACFYEESVIKSEKFTTKKHWYGNKIDTVKHEIVLTAMCKVRAGFDLSMLGDGDLVIKGDTVNIKLPAPKIIDVISNPSNYRTFEEIGDWEHEEIVAMQVDKKDEVLQNAHAHNILQKANQIGKGRVITLFQAFGFNVVNVTLTDVPAYVAPEQPEAAVEQVAPAVEEVAAPVVEVVPAVEEQMPIDTLSQLL